MVFIVGICGGIQSGKTTLCNEIINLLDKKAVVIDIADIGDDPLPRINEAIATGQKIVIVIGPNIFHNQHIASKLNLKIFVECDRDIVLGRIIHNGENIGAAVSKYTGRDKYIDEKYAFPFGSRADIVVPNGREIADLNIAARVVVGYLQSM